MKIHEFGLWFKAWPSCKWFIIVPPEGAFMIHYDGKNLGWQLAGDFIEIYDHQPHIIKLKQKCPKSGFYYYIMNRRLTMDDFEIILNPDYRGDQ